MKHISNEEKIEELAEKSPINWISKEDKCTYRQGFVCGATKIAKWKDEQNAEFLLELKNAFESLAQMCDKLTSGNVAHQRPHLKGFAKGWAEIIDEHLERMKGEQK